MQTRKGTEGKERMRKLRISMPSLRRPGFRLPGLRMNSAVRVKSSFNLNRYVPKFALRLGGTKAVFGSLALVGVAFAAAMFLVIEKTTDNIPMWPEAGAAYALPSEVGLPLPPEDEIPADANHTLQVTLAADARISELTFKDMDLGKAGLTDCVSIERDSGNSSGYLWVDEFVINNVSAPSFDMANVEVATLALAGSVDGHTNSSTLNSTISEITILSTRGSGKFVAESGAVDRIVVMFLADANISTLTFDNVKCSVGGWDIDHVKAGSISQDATSRFGDGDGINVADYVVNQTVSYRTSTDSLVDTPINVR